ncbi:RluA family pseudouridine synthase [Solibacillus sp. FSL K6-1523]|uniref:RluA family pseudouridine synthase n=1 Tax=Solibacillus sp. FSL K6-1523 TaxID=2921471 RepID=UPI0030FBCCAA
MDKRYQLQFTVQEDGQLLRDALAGFGISKRTLTAVKFDGGALYVNGEERNVRHPLNCGDVVTIIFPLEEVSEGLLAEYGELAIVYEDEALLVINKPAYMSTIPSREHPSGSVANYVRGYFGQQGIASTVHIVTRLDRDTSGLMIIAKHRHIHHLLSEQQKSEQLQREYEAIVEGQVEVVKQSIKAPIGRKDTSIIERQVSADGQAAHTDVMVLKHGDKNSHVRLKLYTGRTHQIRVHMAYIGHPLVGDDLYGGCQQALDRQALHCVFVQFPHPLTGEVMTFESQLPIDFIALLNN